MLESQLDAQGIGLIQLSKILTVDSCCEGNLKKKKRELSVLTSNL